MLDKRCNMLSSMNHPRRATKKKLEKPGRAKILAGLSHPGQISDRIFFKPPPQKKKIKLKFNLVVTIPREEGRLQYFVYDPPAASESDSRPSEMEKRPPRVTSAGPWASSSPCPVSLPRSLGGGGAGWALISNTCAGRGTGTARQPKWMALGPRRDRRARGALRWTDAGRGGGRGFPGALGRGARAGAEPEPMTVRLSALYRGSAGARGRRAAHKGAAASE